MSSIYQKGRDGYYYYQSYVLNPKTGKKDKRIFHSLGTKDKETAIKKQIALDRQYENNDSNSFNTILMRWNVSMKNIFPIFVVFAISIFILKLIPNKKQKYELVNNFSDENVAEKKIIDHGLKDNYPIKIKIQNSVDVPEEDINVILEDSQSHTSTSKIIIPKYKIQKVERLSGAFDQGKIFLTVTETVSKETLKKLCEKVKNDHKQFSNLIICIFSESVIGKQLAQNDDSNLSAKEKKQAWLAMYTYNPVEGDYFDDDPTGYLGAF